MTTLSSTPTDLRKIGDQVMKISWSDGHTCEFKAKYLRESCPCAACINELTGEKLLKPGAVSDDIKISKSELTGNYALTFQFSDGHATGIYPFIRLRKICPCGP